LKLHSELDQDQFALLIELATGALGREEALAAEAHAKACATCRNTLAWLRPTLHALHFAPPAVEPPRTAWTAIEERLEALRSPAVQPWKDWAPPADASAEPIRQAAASCWSPTATPGVEVRELAVDQGGASVTMLIRMAAGARYPAHEHGGAEECYVLEGDLVIGELVMHAGDFQRMERGSRHPEQHTRGGCLLFLRSSTADRLL
jgi:anti-sigma factor ChrR (cupin superfamily)